MRPAYGWMALAPLLLLFLPTQAFACGIPLAARIPSEQALVTFADGREEIITSVHLQSERPGAAVIFPVPGEPEVSTLKSDDLFSYLEEVTRPQVREVTQVGDEERGAPAGAAAPGVSLLGRELIGGYDVARLKAGDADALQEWLDQNGYRAPDGAGPILKAYIDEGWKFVAIKLAADRPANGALAPLRMAFESEEIVYPMRLGALSDQPLDVLLYVAADHRVDIPGMETQYAGPIARLDRPPPADLAATLQAPFLTKLRNTSIPPQSLTSDFVAKTATSDQPYRKVEIHMVFVPGARPDLPVGPIIGLIVAIVASGVALGIALGLRRRITKIAGADPEEEDGR